MQPDSHLKFWPFPWRSGPRSGGILEESAWSQKEEVEVAEESVIPEGFDFLSDKITVQED